MSEKFSLTMQSTNTSVGATTTLNGAFSNVSSGTGLTDLFYSSCRGIDQERFIELLNNCWNSSPLYTLKCIAYIRDIRGGKGERQLGQWALEWLASKSSNDLTHNLKSYVDTYGRWDDIFCIVPFNINLVCYIVCNQLKQDIINMNKNEKVSLCAKWVPSEGKAIDKKHKIFSSLAKHMGLNNKTFRQEITRLRKHIDIVETHLCDMTLENVNYEHVPSKCMLIHGKPKNAFPRRDEDRFNEFKSGLQKGEKKINASTLFPHEIVHSLTIQSADEIIDAQWQSMINKLTDQEKQCLRKTMAVVDVSGSMTGGMYDSTTVRPIDVAVAIGLLVAEMNPNPALQNKILTFSSNPQFHDVKGSTLRERYQSINQATWEMTTDFIKAFRLILNTALEHKLTQDDMPDTLVVISDMQFNAGTNQNEYLTNYEVLYKEYDQSGYTVPKLVFWNVNGATTDYPVLAGNTNTALISGFSIDIFKDVLNNQDISPLTTAIRALDRPRYDLICLMK